jgi:hypothetical protein
LLLWGILVGPFFVRLLFVSLLLVVGVRVAASCLVGRVRARRVRLVRLSALLRHRVLRTGVLSLVSALVAAPLLRMLLGGRARSLLRPGVLPLLLRSSPI